MNSLVNCPCGHHLGRHDDDGCDGRSACNCNLTSREALEAAIAVVRRPGPPIDVLSELVANPA